MARKPPKNCATTGCPNPALPGRARCSTHEQERDAIIKGRADHRWIYNTATWRRLRNEYKGEPCDVCGKPSEELDHITPLEAGGEPFDRANLSPLCKRHHSQKTAREVGLGQGPAAR